MADTTVVTSCPSAAALTAISAALRMRLTSATDVPPNFWTRRPMPSHQSKLTEQRLATGLASNDLKVEFVMPIQLCGRRKSTQVPANCQSDCREPHRRK